MKNKVIYVVFIVLSVLLALSVFTSVEASAVVGQFSPNTGTSAAGSVKTIGNNVLGLIQIAGTAIAIGMLLFLAIKYLKAAPDEKANIKQSSVIYIIGAVTLFAAVNIVTIVAKFAEETIKPS